MIPLSDATRITVPPSFAAGIVTVIVPSFSVSENDEERVRNKVEQEETPCFDHLDETSKNICLCLSKTTPKTLEEITQNTNISISDLMSTLTILEIQGIVKAVPGGSFLLC